MLQHATTVARLAAQHIAARLAEHFPLLFSRDCDDKLPEEATTVAEIKKLCAQPEKRF